MPSTPDPLIEVIAAALHRGAPWEYVDKNVRDSYRQDAHLVHAAITATGRLLPEGGLESLPSLCDCADRGGPPTNPTTGAYMDHHCDCQAVTAAGDLVGEANTIHAAQCEHPSAPSLLAATPDTTGTEEGA